MLCIFKDDITFRRTMLEQIFEQLAVLNTQLRYPARDESDVNLVERLANYAVIIEVLLKEEVNFRKQAAHLRSGDGDCKKFYKILWSLEACNLPFYIIHILDKCKTHLIFYD